MTYKALGRSIANYAAPVWSTYAIELNIDNIQHAKFTKMDLPPREMKETIFTRHYQTVLPLLENNRKDILQTLHTSFVNTAIDNMKDNRVLNNDEETLL